MASRWIRGSAAAPVLVIVGVLAEEIEGAHRLGRCTPWWSSGTAERERAAEVHALPESVADRAGRRERLRAAPRHAEQAAREAVDRRAAREHEPLRLEP